MCKKFVCVPVCLCGCGMLCAVRQVTRVCCSSARVGVRAGWMDAARRACVCRLFSEQSAARSSRRIGSRPRIVTNRIVNTRDDVSTTAACVLNPPFWFCALPLVPCPCSWRASRGPRMEMGARGRCEKGKRKSTRGTLGSRSGGVQHVSTARSISGMRKAGYAVESRYLDRV